MFWPIASACAAQAIETLRAAVTHEVRWVPAEKFLTGFGAHRVNATREVVVDPMHPSYSLTHTEARAWAILRVARRGHSPSMTTPPKP